MKNLTLLTIISILLFANYGYADDSMINSSAPNKSRGYYPINVSDHYNVDADDPLENYNRNAFRFNQTIDRILIRPAAVAYLEYVPNPVRGGIRNFYNNLRDFVTLGDDILQFQGIRAMHTTMRIAINSTFGLVGFIDVSSSLGLMDDKNTFGNTLKFYGWKNSSYFVIPFLGSSTIRDAIGIVPDTYFNPVWIVMDNTYGSTGLFVVNGIDTRTKYLGVDQLQNLAIDPYIATRDAYLQSIGEKTSSSNYNIDQELGIGDSESSTQNSKK